MMPAALRERLGPFASAELHDLLESERDEMLNIAAERFDRKLAEFDARVTGEFARVRVEFHESLAAVRGEVQQGLTTVRREIGDARVDMLKWSFVFWIGQVAAIAALLSFMLRRVA